MGTKNWDSEPAPERFGQLPLSRGVVFVCRSCRRPYAAARDAVLRAWGERGVIAEAAAKLRCSVCKERGMRAFLSPTFADLGSPTPLDRLVQTIRGLIARGRVE